MNEQDIHALHKEIVGLFAQVFALTARALKKLAEFDAANGAAVMGYQSTAHYLHFTASLSMSTGRDHVRVAKALAELPLLSAAFEAGSVSYSKVRAIARIANAENEAAMLNLANCCTAAQIEKLVRGCVRVTRDDAKKRSAARACTTRYDEDGMFVMTVRLLPDEGARMLSALEQRMPPRDCSRSYGQMKADALLALIDTSTPAEVILHVEGDSCQVQTAQGELVSTSAETCRRAACDGAVVMMLHDRDGTVLDVGRKTRKIPAGLKRALSHRDQGCRYPGCPNTIVDAHHIMHWGVTRKLGGNRWPN